MPAEMPLSPRCPPLRARRRPNLPPLCHSPARHCHCHHLHPCRGKSSHRPQHLLPSPLPRPHRHCSGRPRPRHRQWWRVAPCRRPPPPSRSRWTAAQGYGPLPGGAAWPSADAAAPQTMAREVAVAVAAVDAASWPPVRVPTVHLAGGGVWQVDASGGRSCRRCRRRRCHGPRRPRGHPRCWLVGLPTEPDVAGCAAYRAE